MPTFGSLFAGIGGIDLGLERAGWTGRWQVEWDPYCQRVLEKHWPGLPRYGDITQVDWSGVERVDLLAGGFPCQPVSAAGQRKAQDDERWLWPEFARAIRELRPSYVLVENVRNLLAVNDGSAFAEVLRDLAASGYDAEWDCIPAAAVGAPHDRDRLWLVAYADRKRRSVVQRSETVAAGAGFGAASSDGGGPPMADSIGGQRARDWSDGRMGAIATDTSAVGSRSGPRRDDWRPQSRVVRGPDGLSDRLDGHRWPAPPGPQAEWEPPRIAPQGLPNRGRRVKALGNAVVPQVVEVIGRQLLEAIERAA